MLDIRGSFFTQSMVEQAPWGSGYGTKPGRAQIHNGIPGMSCALSGAGLDVLEGSLLTQDIL